MISTITDTALALSAWVELSILSKATLLLALGLTAARLAVRARASVRHLLLATTFAAVLALPLIAILAPGVTIEVPVSAAPDSVPVSRVVPQTNSPISSTASAPVSRSMERDGWTAPSWPTIARSLWLAGALLMLVPPAAGLLRLRRIRREGLPWPELHQLVESLATRCGIRRSVEVLLHEEIPAPLTFGAWRPVIILPCDAREWNEGDMRRALVHELEHVRRGDWTVQLSARAICALYWFHPLVWVAWRSLRLEAERASDDAVLETAERTEYAEQLVLLAGRLSRAHNQATLGMANRSDLSARVSTVLDGTRRRGRAGLLASTSAMCVATLLVLAIAPVRAVAQSAKRSPVETVEYGRFIDPPVVNSDAPDRVETLAQAEVEYRNWTELFANDDPIADDVLIRMAETHLRQIMALEGQALTQSLKERGRQRSEPLDRALFEAAERGDTSAIDTLLKEGANVNCALDGDGSPLIGAALNGHITAVRLLLDRGADPNMPVEGDGNPLIMAAREGHAEVVALLLDRGANIDQTVPGDENALIQASAEGHLGVVKLLISREADVNARAWVDRAFKRPNGEWRTPLSMARKGGHEAVVKFLLESGARD